jgi:hypothetical protein
VSSAVVHAHLQGESRDPKKDMVYVDAEGHQRHVKDAGAQLVERQRTGPAVGKAMRVVAGTHAGLLCTVLEIEPKARPPATPAPRYTLPWQAGMVLLCEAALPAPRIWSCASGP